ncbi:asparagine synthetase B [Candidatus Woesearchaeota archaeon]|nr:asparagine synthetase B [Candidatus Woesearchaeota archaeon]
MQLIEENKWKSLIESLKTDFNNLETNKERAKRILKERIIEAVKKNAVDNCGVLFSGGVDSTLIAFILKKINIKFTCYSVGLENAQDLQFAEKVASALSFDLKTKVITLEEFEQIVKKVVKILNEPDVTKVGVGSVVYAASLLAKKDKVNVLFSGLGSEELFAGYERHLVAFGNNNFEALHKECWDGLINMWKRDLDRDFRITKNVGVDVRAPFLDVDVIKTAMSIHPVYKIDKSIKKIIVREIAEDFGIPKEFSWRPKKAAQYGSKFIIGIDKLAKNKGFKLKRDYLQNLVDVQL